MGSSRVLPVMQVLVAAALFGAAAPVAKPLLGVLGTFRLAGLLYLGAASAVAPAALWHGPPDRTSLSRNAKRLAGVVLLGGGLAPLLLFWGLSMASAASVSLWLNLETVATVVLAGLFFREHLHRRTWLGVALIVAASLMLASPPAPGGRLAGLLVALASVCWGVDNNLTALIDGLSPAQTTLLKGVVAGTVNLCLGLCLDGGPAPGRVVAAALLLGASSYGASLVLYIGGAQQLGAARSQMIFSTASFWGLSVAWLLLSEPMLWTQALAGAVMLAALWLLCSERHEHAHTHEGITHRHDDGHHQHLHPRLPSWIGHTHEHTHDPVTHTHPHLPDLQHRHRH